MPLEGVNSGYLLKVIKIEIKKLSPREVS